MQSSNDTWLRIWKKDVKKVMKLKGVGDCWRNSGPVRWRLLEKQRLIEAIKGGAKRAREWQAMKKEVNT